VTGKEARATNDDLAPGTAELQETVVDHVQGARLDAQRAPLAAILSSLRDGVLLVDLDGGTILSNEAYERIAASGHPELEDDEGRPVATAEGLRARAARGESFTGQFRTIRSDGTRRWYEVVGQPVDIEGDRFGGVVVIRDMTDRSRRRLQDEFVAIVAHELRTPLTALRGYLELSDRALSDRQSDDGQQFVRLALEQASRLQSLIGELFDSARSDTGKLSFQYADVDLNGLVRSAAEVARTLSERHRVEITVPEENLVIRADAGRIRQVLLNVLANAINHAPDTERIEVALVRAGDEADLRVTDHGPGIPADILPQLFSRYGQARPNGDGLGLGLFISREIITAHQGTIDAAATPGGGTTIIIRLPIMRVQGSEARPVARASRSGAAPVADGIGPPRGDGQSRDASDAT
jgi:two-component system CheB/CheR fusion protein